MEIKNRRLLIHGILLLAMIIACCVNLNLIMLWNLGYAIYFMTKLVAKCTRDMTPLFFKIITIIVLSIGSTPLVMIMVIPSWFICVSYSISNPETAVNLQNYTFRGIQLRNVTYYRDYNSYFLEGDIEENELKQLAILKDWKFAEKDECHLQYIATTRIQAHQNKSIPDFIKMENVLVLSSYKEGDDCGESIVYDPKIKRLYFHSTLR